MECNKDEAIKAKGIAAQRMESGNYEGALKIAQKAQRLFPELENITQILTVCNVHCSAEKKLNALDMDWYGILQIQQFSDESTVKKQYRKLALLLHPDKNKFAGAEAAFKLVGEANRVLTDQAKRSVYDMKCRAQLKVAPKPPPPKPATNVAPKPASNFQNRPTPMPSSNQPNRAAPVPPFNPSMRTSYGNAQNSFPNAAPQFMASNTNQQAQQPFFYTCCTSCGVKNQYHRIFADRLLICQKCKASFIARDLGPQGDFFWNQSSKYKEAPNEARYNGPSQVNGEKPAAATSFSQRFAGQNPVPKEKPAAKMDQASKTEKKVDGSADAGAQRNGFEESKARASESTQSGARNKVNKKRSRKSTEEDSESFETNHTGDSIDDADFEENSGKYGQNSNVSGDHRPRRSARSKQPVSYKENVGGEGDITSPSSKRPKVSEFSSKMDNKKEEVDSVTKDDDLAGAAAADPHAEEMEVDEDPDEVECPDPEFNDFDKYKAENCFAVDQLWAVYDTLDGMPRFYARVRKVFSGRFKLKITWLEASPDEEECEDWYNNDLPVSCGKFRYGNSEETTARLMFSHQVDHVKRCGRNFFHIHPRKGETWALFKDWDIKWASDAEKHQPPYKYDFVEVISDFDEESGIGLTYLGKVKGFVSLFRQTAQDGVASFQVSPSELYRFSHRIPSFRMTGMEREDVPAGSFEFDPSSLPTNIDEVVGPNPTKAENKIQTPKKSMKHDIPSDGLKLRRSPRSTKDSKQQQDTDKTSISDKDDKSSSFTHTEGAPLRNSADDPRVHARSATSKSVPKSPTDSVPAPSGHKTPEKGGSASSWKKSEKKFQVGEIWALYNSKDGKPNDYAQIKKIESAPKFRLHVALLELCLTSKGSRQPIGCGIYEVKSGKTKAVPRESLSHQVVAELDKNNSFKIYPRKGEIWALCKDNNSGECDIVEVVDDANEKCSKVVVLTCVNGLKSLYRAPKSQRSRSNAVEVSKAEYCRFSHQIPAFQHNGEEDSRWRGYWELDPVAVTGYIICLD